MTSTDPTPPTAPTPPAPRVHHWFHHNCHATPAGPVLRLLKHVIDVSGGVAAWLELDERERPTPSSDEAPPATPRAPDAAMRGLCIAALELMGDQARRLTGRVGEQPLHPSEFGVMPPWRRGPPAPPR
jgi:hypothetical protein